MNTNRSRCRVGHFLDERERAQNSEDKDCKSNAADDIRICLVVDNTFLLEYNLLWERNPRDNEGIAAHHKSLLRSHPDLKQSVRSLLENAYNNLTENCYNWNGTLRFDQNNAMFGKGFLLS